ncbi:MAG: hypothetical protein ACK48Y_19435 [Planctomyces sp.]
MTADNTQCYRQIRGGLDMSQQDGPDGIIRLVCGGGSGGGSGGGT